MLKRLPLIPTLLVLIAVGIMIRLGFWQLDRMGQKDELLARYQAAASNQETLAGFPQNSDPADQLYRRVKVSCGEVRGWRSISGTNDRGESGIAHIAECKLTDRFTFDGPGYDVLVSVGWSRNPANPAWQGGEVSGMIAPFKDGEVKIVADPPLAGLAPNARPDPGEIPNNHWSYAIQWFLFALVALVIYGIALRKRLAVKGAEG